MLFTSASADIASWDEARIEVLSLETGARRVLIEGGTYARYASTGHIVYARAGSLYAVPFDPQRIALAGTPVQVVDGVVTDGYEGWAHFALSREGSLVYTPGPVAKFDSTLLWVDRQGRTEPVTTRRDAFMLSSLSADGQRIAVQVRRASDEIWIYDVGRDTLTRLASGWNNQSPIWTPDGTRTTFTSDRDGVRNLYWQAADGSGPAERLTTSTHEQIPNSWSPDGKALAFQEIDPESGSDIWTLSIDGDGKPRPFLRDRFHEGISRFSPDGRWLTYTSTETGRPEVYVRPYPGPGGK